MRISLVPLLVLLACSQNQKADTELPDLNDDTAGGDTDSGGGDTGGGDTGPVEDDFDGDGQTESGGDCDDADASVYTGAPELCDGKDNDCDGRSDADDDVDADGISDCNDYCPVYVAEGAAGDGRYMDPLGVVQDAVDLAGGTLCNEVRVFEGTYRENVVWNGWPVNAESLSGPERTVLDGGGVDAVVAFQDGEGEDSRIYGFTLTNGGGGEGAGVRVVEASPTIEGNHVVDNATTVYPHVGGGVRIKNGSPVVLDNYIAGNDAGYTLDEDGSDGGGINVRGGAAWIQGNTLVGNTAGDGGGIWIAYSDATIVNNLIAGNAARDNDLEAGGQGGGINVQIGGAIETWVVANVIVGNEASMYGGGIVTYEDHDTYPYTTIENNVIAWNSVVDTDYGAGLLQWRRTTPLVVNNLVVQNDGVGVYSEDGIDGSFAYNGVWGNATDLVGLAGSGAGNLSADPRFRGVSDDGDWTNDDWRLSSGSPAVDAGDPAILDVDGSRSDLGAYGGPAGSW